MEPRMPLEGPQIKLTWVPGLCNRKESPSFTDLKARRRLGWTSPRTLQSTPLFRKLRSHAPTETVRSKIVISPTRGQRYWMKRSVWPYILRALVQASIPHTCPKFKPTHGEWSGCVDVECALWELKSNLLDLVAWEMKISTGSVIINRFSVQAFIKTFFLRTTHKFLLSMHIYFPQIER